MTHFLYTIPLYAIINNNMNIQFDREYSPNYFLIDNQRIGRVNSYYTDHNQREVAYDLYPELVNFESFMSLKISDFPKKIRNIYSKFKLNPNIDSTWFLNSDVKITTTDPYYETLWEARLFIKPDLNNWQRRYPISRFIQFSEELCDEYDRIEFQVYKESDLIERFGLYYSFEDNNTTLRQVYEKLVSTISKIITAATDRCIAELKEHSVTSIFNFPEEIKQPCEQYLIYFSKFLQDLGIEASTSIEQEAQNVLFMVTPKDPSQALSQIRDALSIYLKLPEIDDIEKYSVNNNDVGVQQLVSNIYHLKSQLLLSQSIIQAKDATIKTLNFNNYQQTLLINQHIDSKKNEEKLLNDVVTIKEFEGKGFKINLPKLFRMIMRKRK